MSQSYSVDGGSDAAFRCQYRSSLLLLGRSACTEGKDAAIVTDVAWSVCVSVCLLVITASCAKTDELIEMAFEASSRVGPMNHVLSGARIPRLAMMRPFVNIL